MLTGYWYAILDKWKQVGWIPPLPTLDRHIEHLAGGMAFAWVALLAGFDPLGACIISTVLSTLIEGATAISKDNWKDSTFDWVQYQSVWIPFLVFVFGWWLAFPLYLFLYFVLLLRGW